MPPLPLLQDPGSAQLCSTQVSWQGLNLEAACVSSLLPRGILFQAGKQGEDAVLRSGAWGLPSSGSWI